MLGIDIKYAKLMHVVILRTSTEVIVLDPQSRDTDPRVSVNKRLKEYHKSYLCDLKFVLFHASSSRLHIPCPRRSNDVPTMFESHLEMFSIHRNI